MAAIGGSSRRWLNKPTGAAAGATSNQSKVQDTEQGPETGTARGQPRARRATLADVLFVIHQHPRLSRHPTLIYRYSNMSGK